MSSYWLSFSIWVPIVAGLIVLVAGDRNRREAKVIALLGPSSAFAVTVPLVTGFQTGTSAMQFVEIGALDPALQRETTTSGSTASRCCSSC